jgi:hypothetical protein
MNGLTILPAAGVKELITLLKKVSVEFGSPTNRERIREVSDPLLLAMSNNYIAWPLA